MTSVSRVCRSLAFPTSGNLLQVALGGDRGDLPPLPGPCQVLLGGDRSPLSVLRGWGSDHRGQRLDPGWEMGGCLRCRHAGSPACSWHTAETFPWQRVVFVFGSEQAGSRPPRSGPQVAGGPGAGLGGCCSPVCARALQAARELLQCPLLLR